MPGELLHTIVLSDDVIENIHVVHLALRELQDVEGSRKYIGFGFGTYTQSTTETYFGFWFDVDGDQVLLEPQFGNTTRHHTNGESDVVKYHLHHGIECVRMSSEQAMEWLRNK